MNYSVPGEILARLLVAAGSRLDADEIGEIIHRIRPIVDMQAAPVEDETAEKPAKPEA